MSHNEPREMPSMLIDPEAEVREALLARAALHVIPEEELSQIAGGALSKYSSGFGLVSSSDSLIGSSGFAAACGEPNTSLSTCTKVCTNTDPTSFGLSGSSSLQLF